MGRLVSAWARDFARFQPHVRIENHMYGTSSAIGALSLGVADIAILGEEISPATAAEFRRAKGYAPTEIDIATGSLDVPFFDYAHVIFVAKDNPIDRMTLSQLDAIFGAEHRRSPHAIRTWGELGAGGEWANQPITPYGWKDLDFSLLFQNVVMGGSHRWNPALHEFSHVHRADGTQYDAGQQIVDALATDRYGIALSSLHYATPLVKPVALAVLDRGPYVAPTKESLIAQTYPLTRIIPAFVDVRPGHALDPAVREFLRYVLSARGQEAIVRESSYLRLGAGAVRAQLGKLDSLASGAPATRAARCGVREPAPGLKIWGNAAMRGPVGRWQNDFHRSVPGVATFTQFPGSDVALAGLYTGCADIALIGREPTPNEIQAFEWIHRYKPTAIPLMRGGIGAGGPSPALAVLVRGDNPLVQLTLGQLEAIFSTDPRNGPRIARWSDLGFGGEWTDQTISLYGPDAYSGRGRFFRHVAMADSRKLDWDRMHEFPSPADERVVAALESDRFGIGIASSGASRTGLKEIALAASAAGPFLLPTSEAVRAGTYPFSRTVYAVVDRPPDRAANPNVQAFLDVVLRGS